MLSRISWYLCLATLVRAQTGYLTYPVGTSPSGIAAADFNGDAKPDLAVANTLSNSLTILINNGSGAFTPQPALSLASAPQSILAADFNGDHKTDLVVLFAASVPQVTPASGLAVLLGNGDGTFQPPLPVSSCPQPISAQIADLNGDGIPDLALTCLTYGFLIPTGANISIQLGKGDGTFSQGPFFFLGLTPWAVLTIADFNKDGTPDIAVAVGHALTIFLNDGKANFKSIVLSPQPWNFAPGIAAGDFNGDGIADLAVTSQSFANPALGVITILPGNGDGTFAAPSSLQTSGFAPVAALDLNGDGRPDLVEGLSGLTFFAGRGDGTFTPSLPFGSSGNSGFFALADFTGSGTFGFAAANHFAASDSTPTPGNIVVLPRAVWPSSTFANTAATTFSLGPLAPGSIATAFGAGLATQTAGNDGTVSLLGGAAVSLTDATGATRPAGLFWVSPTQVNYVIPAGTAPGLATVAISAGGSVTASGLIAVVPVAPSLFTLNSGNLADAEVLRISQDGAQTFEPVFQVDSTGNLTALPVDLSSATDAVYLELFGTGIRNLRAPNGVTVTLSGALNAQVTYAGAQGTVAGLDQVNLRLPRVPASAAPHTVVLQLAVDGLPSNQVTLLIQ